MIRRFAWMEHNSLRRKLLFLTLVPLGLTAIGVALMVAYWSSSYGDRQLYMKVSADLAVAQGTLEIMQQDQLNTLIQLANGYQFRTSLQLQDQRHLRVQLLQVRNSRKLDILRLIPRQQLPQMPEPGLHKLLPRLLNSEPLAGLTVLSAAELDQIQPGLSQRAHIQLLSTPHALPTSRTEEARAMVLRTLYPVHSQSGELIGVLDAGTILNNSTRVVDTIRDLVYGPGTLPTGGIGTVTLFLDDVRISTNVPQQVPDQVAGKTLSLQDRAIGTRVSEEVRHRVLTAGDKWIDRAFVVNDWYISAYRPLLDFDNKKIGMIYTGFNEAPFSRIYYKTLLEAASIIGLIMLVASVVVLNYSRLLLRPLGRIQAVVRAVRDGDMTQRIGALETRDELAELARQFDVMLELLAQREREITRANDALEITVDQRTRSLRRRTQALKQHIRLLKNTRKQLLDKEKLAVLGELTAGIAHEINNPAAVILGNIDLLVAELGDAAAPVQAEVDMVVEQVYRIRSLINNLLQYSRPEHYLEYHQMQSVNEVVDDTLQLVRHALDQQKVEVERHFTADCPVEINPQQIQQVLVNLVLNASHALSGPGRIHIATRNWLDDAGDACGAVIDVSDRGQGISPENLARIFDPFFTTKKSGTGLGLSVSYGIVRRQGGDISVSSDVGKGTRFSVHLRQRATKRDERDTELGGILAGLAAAERTNRRALQE